MGENNEHTALENNKSEMGHKDIVVTRSGMWISPDYFFLGACAYDPLEPLPWFYRDQEST